MITTHTGEPSGVLVVVRIRVQVSVQRVSSVSLTPSTPQSLAAWAWVCRFAAPSLKRTRGGLWATAAQPQGASFQFTVPEQSNEAA